MEIYSFIEGQRPQQLQQMEKLPGQGFVWLDFSRDRAQDWPAAVASLTGVRIHDAHFSDSLNEAHPSFFDSADDYEMVIFRGLASQNDLTTFETRPTAIFLLDRLLVTVRPSDSISVALVKRRLLELTSRIPQRPVGLMHLILSAMIDRFMALREPLTRQIEEWQRDLLDPTHPFNDWMALLGHRNRLGKLEVICDEHQDAVMAWREDTTVQIDDHLAVRINDILEHIRRVSSTAEHLQSQIESLVQIHFSAVAHRSSEVMRVLTVVTAIFLPLTLVAGVFGMNFKLFPPGDHPLSFAVAVGFMTALGTALFVYFKRRKWI
jgi:Mg2+ and Co2+ transporter CorA